MPLIDARERFHPQALIYTVQIKVEINVGFLWAVLKCLFTRKDLLITHRYTNDPILVGNLDVDASD